MADAVASGRERQPKRWPWEDGAVSGPREGGGAHHGTRKSGT